MTQEQIPTIIFITKNDDQDQSQEEPSFQEQKFRHIRHRVHRNGGIAQRHRQRMRMRQHQRQMAQNLRIHAKEMDHGSSEDKIQMAKNFFQKFQEKDSGSPVEQIWNRPESGETQKVIREDRETLVDPKKFLGEDRNVKLRAEFNAIPYPVSQEVEDNVNREVVNKNYEYERDEVTGEFRPRKPVKYEDMPFFKNNNISPGDMRLKVHTPFFERKAATSEESREVIGEIGTPFMNIE